MTCVSVESRALPPAECWFLCRALYLFGSISCSHNIIFHMSTRKRSVRTDFFHAFINRPSARHTPTIVWIARLAIPPTLISWEKVNKGDFFEGTAVTLAFDDNGMGSERYYWEAGCKQLSVCFFLSLWHSIRLLPPGHSLSSPLSSSLSLLYSIPFVGGVGLPQEGADF